MGRFGGRADLISNEIGLNTSCLLYAYNSVTSESLIAHTFSSCQMELIYVFQMYQITSREWLRIWEMGLVLFLEIGRNGHSTLSDMFYVYLDT